MEGGGTVVVRLPAEVSKTSFYESQTGSGTHTASYSKAPGSSFFVGKTAGE